MVTYDSLSPNLVPGLSRSAWQELFCEVMEADDPNLQHFAMLLVSSYHVTLKKRPDVLILKGLFSSNVAKSHTLPQERRKSQCFSYMLTCLDFFPRRKSTHVEQLSLILLSADISYSHGRDEEKVRGSSN